MSGRCNRDELEALVYGELAPDRIAEVEGHAVACTECADELAWLRAERSAMAERAQGEAELPPALWAGIEARIASEEAALAPQPAPTREPERRGLLATLFPFGGRSGERARWFGFGLATAAAAAALMFVVMRGERAPQSGQVARAADAGAVQQPDETSSSGDRVADAERAIDEAEAAHLAAIAALEAAYKESRDSLDPAVAVRFDEQFEGQRATLEDARAEAGDDMGARLRLLDAYAAHRRSMKSALARMQENE